MTDVTTTLRSAYLAGPMRGHENFNFPAFHVAARWLRDEGWHIYSPAERDEADYQIPSNQELRNQGHDWSGTTDLAYFMSFDLKAVCEHDAVICLPGWETSQGARLETMVAVEVGHPVFELVIESRSALGYISQAELKHVNPTYIGQVFAERSTNIWDGPEDASPAFDVEPPEDLFDDTEPVGPQDVEAEAYRQGFVSGMSVGEKLRDLNEDGPDLAKEERAMRTFETGATRNVVSDPDYHGFFSPLAMHMYGQYMHAHRFQADGTVRASNNWQRGIPFDSFMESMQRHVHDLELIHDGYPELAREDLDSALSGILFNTQGYMHFVMKSRLELERQLAEAA